ncbi:MAG: hypothetical protein KH111_06655 [Bacteroidales bacterium]|nr:hypothetical protein [Bacteroidales bacterium]
MPELSKRLTKEFDHEFNATKLKYMRLFYNTFLTSHAPREQLIWMRYRSCVWKSD